MVATKDGIPIYLSSLADVVMGKEERSIVRIDGKPGIVVSVRKRADANTVATADEVYRCWRLNTATPTSRSGS